MLNCSSPDAIIKIELQTESLWQFIPPICYFLIQHGENPTHSSGISINLGSYGGR